MGRCPALTLAFFSCQDFQYGFQPIHDGNPKQRVWFINFYSMKEAFKKHSFFTQEHHGFSLLPENHPRADFPGRSARNFEPVDGAVSENYGDLHGQKSCA